MLENRSFDQMLGFSALTGTDAETGQPTEVNGLAGTESNSYQGQAYPVGQPGADWSMPVDPGHEFPDVLIQLSGPNATYPPAGPYPPIDNSGFVSDYAASPSRKDGEGNAPDNFGEIMKCYATRTQLPVLYALAKEFAVCDRWHASIPGPTWPNRFFVHAASSGGLDHSPTTAEIATWESVAGFAFVNGTIFDRLAAHNADSPWRIYRGASSPWEGSIPCVSALKGIDLSNTRYFDHFAQDLMQSSYPWPYTFIEPNYGDITGNTYIGGTSQHPRDDVRNGEGLIKATYEALRKSPLWEQSLLIITWDEHGGFFDHVAPPTAVPPRDTQPGSQHNQYGFAFDRYGVRVPAVVVSPFIGRNVIDHRLYDHSSIPKALESTFGLDPMTDRDRHSADPSALLTLSDPRTDAPQQLPDPAQAPAMAQARVAAAPQINLGASVDQGNLPALLAVVLRAELQSSPASEHAAIMARFQAVKTRRDAQEYLAAVQPKLRAAERL
jgi:phospholipase C